MQITCSFGFTGNLHFFSDVANEKDLWNWRGATRCDF